MGQANSVPRRINGAEGTPGQRVRSGGPGVCENWEDDIVTRDFIIDGGGSVIATGEHGHIVLDYNCEIEQVSLLADQSGSIKIDIWKDTYANFPPDNADSICGGNEPEIVGAQKDQDSTLTGWTTGITAGDILAFNVDSCTTIERVTVSLKLRKT